MTERLPERAPGRADRREDARVLLWTAAVVGGSFALGSAIQAAYIYATVAEGWSAVDVWSRVAVNVVTVAAFVALLVLWRQHRRSTPTGLALGIVLTALGASAVRVAVQVPLGVYPSYARGTTTAEFLSGLGAGLVAAGFATGAMLSRRRARGEARAAERLAVERAFAIRALEDEELRVRRDVAEGLHASVQQRLVLAVAQTAAVARRLRDGSATVHDAAVLEEICAGLDQVRDQDVRGMSRLLYPDQLEVGLVPAVRALLRRVPTSIATRLDVDPEVRAMDDPASPLLATTERLLAVRVVEEGIGNALRHAQPTSLAIAICLEGGRLSVTVEDDGGGLPAEVNRSGTRRLAERLAVVGGTLELAAIEGAGTRLTGRLPVAAASRT